MFKFLLIGVLGLLMVSCSSTPRMKKTDRYDRYYQPIYECNCVQVKPNVLICC